MSSLPDTHPIEQLPEWRLSRCMQRFELVQFGRKQRGFFVGVERKQR